MTPAEWRDKTVADLEKRKKKREYEKLKGEREARSFVIENQYKWNKEVNKIRKRSYRGR